MNSKLGLAVVAGLTLAGWSTAEAGTQGQWTYAGQVVKSSVTKTTYAITPLCPQVLDDLGYCMDTATMTVHIANETPSDACIRRGGVLETDTNRYCPEIAQHSGSDNWFISNGASPTCCRFTETSMPAYPGNPHDMIFYKADPAVTFGVEAALFKQLDPVNSLAHVETCATSSGGYCQTFWGERADLNAMIASLQDRYTPHTFFGKLLAWASVGGINGTKKVTCNVLLKVADNMANGVRNNGGWRQWWRTPRQAAAFLFRPTYVPASVVTAFDTAANDPIARPYDYASLTIYATNGPDGWGGCSAAQSSAWGLSTAEGDRATNKGAATMCSLAKSVKNTVVTQLTSGVGTDFLGTETSKGLSSCQALGLSPATVIGRVVTAFLNGSMARGDRGYQSFTDANGNCDTTVVKDVSFVTAPSDLFDNMLGGSPSLSDTYAQCSSTDKSTCAANSGQCVKRNGVSACWYTTRTRGSCPAGTWETAPLGTYPGSAFAQTNPAFFQDGNDKCLRYLNGACTPLTCAQIAPSTTGYYANGCGGQVYCTVGGGS